MKAWHYINRFRDTPAWIESSRIGYVDHVDLGVTDADGDARDAYDLDAPAFRDRYTKSDGYPVHLPTLDAAAAAFLDRRGERALVAGLEMEMGPFASWLLSNTADDPGVAATRGGRAEAMRHVGRVVHELKRRELPPYFWYGFGWWRGRDQSNAGRIVNDLAVWGLTGRLSGWGLPLYGALTPDWLDRVSFACRRGLALHNETAGLFRPVLFVSPTAGGLLDPRAFSLQVRVAINSAHEWGGDVVIWADGGQERAPYETIRPQVEEALAELDAEGVALGGAAPGQAA